MLAGAINIICGAAEYNVEFDPSSRRETLFKLNSPARLGGGWYGQDGGRGLVVVMTPPVKLGTSCPSCFVLSHQTR
jgi:hypothetical protein